MSDKFGISASSVICGAASGESDRGVSGEMADGLKSETLIGNPGDRGFLSDGVRVSKKGLDGESTVNSQTELKPVESGKLEANDKMDASRNRDVQTVSRRNNSDRWESWGVMNMVGRVLDGKLYMDNEVEDIAGFENGGVNLAAEKDACQDVIREPTSENISDNKSSHFDKDPVKLDSSCPSEGSGLNVNQDSISHETVPIRTLETEEEFNDECDLFIPKARGEHDITEKEGEYYVSDLVWGKVRSHPWWPGQIFSPLSASDKAAIHLKPESYLIAYFGDHTFAWNEGSKIKPFRMYFSEMEKQSSSDRFSHAVQCALDEAARRVEFGLSCQCLPQEARDVINFQVTENAGVLEGKRRISGGDNLSGAATFSPGNIMELLESLAERPRSKPDRLQFVIAKAQLVAYNRWRGHYRLPVFEVCGGLSEDDTLLNEARVIGGVLPGPVSEAGNGVSSKKRKSTARDGSSRKHRHLSGDAVGPKIKEKSLSDLMSSGSSSSQINDRKSESRSTTSAVSSGENRETVNSVASNSNGRRGRKRKSLLSPSAGGVSQKVQTDPAEIANPDIFLSELILAAKEPTKGHNAILGLLHGFRNSICLEKNGAIDVQIDSGKCTREQQSDFQTTNIFRVDSYWTDRIIQSHSQDQMFSKKPEESGAQAEDDVPIFPNMDNREGSDNMDLDAARPSVVVNEASDDYRPTTLILNFSNVESIPSVPNLNEIFSRYGPLNESETKILTKGKRAKVVFKRREDAETAFSSTGKYSIFGPALVSYRLHYALKSQKPGATLKQNKKANP